VKTTFDRIVRRLASHSIDSNRQDDSDLRMDFMARCRAMRAPKVLELGVKRSIESRRTRHDDWIPDAAEFLGTDIEPGLDVDIVADVHRLSQVTGEEQFDVIISCSSFEHFKYPHVAAHEILKALRIGGLLFIQTHQSFPLHGYPYDYFRFSREALASLFGSRMGFRTIATDYEFPAGVLSRREPQLVNLASYLNVRLYGEKTNVTPQEYVYEFDAP
jgi:SAM-dependent methyltransferase